MLKKIILPVVLLLFTQQELYGMEVEEKDSTDWESINKLVNVDRTKEEGEQYPKLWWLWTILDNITFQYGGSKI